MLPQNINALIDQGELDAALESLDNYLAEASGDDEALYQRGRVLWRLGRHHEAMTDYAAAVAANPQSPAAVALEQAREVFAFFNPDMFNP